jgi:4-carboxymuconolactone decarboxylase
MTQSGPTAWSNLSKTATLDHQLAEEVSVADSDLFQKGLKKRKQVLGEKYVDANLAGSDEFMMTFQRAVTELAWGYAWSRPGLDQKTRSLLTLGILGGLGRFQELGIYVNAALASGVTVDEIKEALVQITVYCGTPAGRQAFLAGHDALKQRSDELRARPCPLVARTGGRRSGRASPLCPGISYINLFSYCEGVIDLDPEVSDRALDLGIPSKSWAGSPCIAACLRHPNERSQIGHVEPH